MKIETKTAIIAILILAIGVAAGALGHRALVKHRIKVIRKVHGPGHAFARNPHDLFVRRFTQIIDPTPEQQEQIKAVLEKNRDKFGAIEQEFRKSTHELAESVRVQVDSILTPEQRTKLETRHQKRWKKFGKHGRRKGPFGGPSIAGPGLEPMMGMHMMMLDSILDLTPKQKEKLEEFHKSMMERRESRRLQRKAKLE